MKDLATLLKAYVLPILVILVVVLIVPLVLLPQLSKIRDKNLEVQKGQERLLRLNQKISLLAEVNEDEESLKLLEVEKAVPSDKRLAQSIVGIRALADQAGLKVAEMNLKPGKVATEAATPSAKTKAKRKAAVEDRLIFSVKLEDNLDTGLDRIKNFLAALEKTKRLLSVDSVATKIDKENKLYTFEVEIFAPFKVVESHGDVIAEPLPVLSKIHQTIYKFLAGLASYTNITVPPVNTGVEDPFK